MKKTIYLLITLGILVSCSDDILVSCLDDDNHTENIELISKWKLIEIYNKYCEYNFTLTGTHTITASARDDYGNTAIKSLKINVLSNNAPII